MGVCYLDIKSVRNLQAVTFSPHPVFNVFYGQNGSGKTSILEAIYLLGRGKSFRQHPVQSLIHYEMPALCIFAWLEKEREIKIPVGIEKTKEGRTSIRIEGKSSLSAAPLAQLLPLQVIHPDSDILMTGSPKWRRQFLDWGAFHVEPLFLSAWQNWQKILKQRNAVLKATQDKGQVSAWDKAYVEASEMVSRLRKRCLEDFEPYFQEIIQYFLPSMPLRLSYERGWPGEEELLTLLPKNFYRDIQLGYTEYGPQRDDMAIIFERYAAGEVLSRGEQKLTVTALQLAQGKFLKEKANKQCIYLMDDFAAELDIIHRGQVVKILSQLGAQVFLTAIEYEEIHSSLKGADFSLFHVEQGKVQQAV